MLQALPIARHRGQPLSGPKGRLSLEIPLQANCMSPCKLDIFGEGRSSPLFNFLLEIISEVCTRAPDVWIRDRPFANRVVGLLPDLVYLRLIDWLG